MNSILKEVFGLYYRAPARAGLSVQIKCHEEKNKRINGLEGQNGASRWRL